MRSVGIKGPEEGRMKILGFGWAAGRGAAPGASASVAPLPLAEILFSTLLVFFLFLVAARLGLRAVCFLGAIAIAKYSPCHLRYATVFLPFSGFLAYQSATYNPV